MQHTPEPQSERYDVVVSGMGPSGLLTAILALLSDKSVCVITNRKAGVYSREQKVVLDENARHLLHEIYIKSSARPRLQENIDDITFLKLIDDKHWIPISMVESFLHRQLQALGVNPQNTLKIYDESSLTDVHLQQGKATLKPLNQDEAHESEVALQFDHLIGADGTGHHSLDLVNDNLPRKRQIKHSKDFNNPHPYHIGIQNIRIKLPESHQQKDQEETHINVAKDGLYYSVVLDKKQTSDEATCNITCEITKELYDALHEARAALMNANEETSDEQYEKLNEDLLLAEVNIEAFVIQKIITALNQDDLQIILPRDTHGRLVMSSFISVLMQASKPSIMMKNEDGNTVLYTLIGDSFRTPYYPLGHGLNDSFREAIAMKSLFESDEKSFKSALKEYNSICSQAGRHVKINLTGVSLLGRKRAWGKSAAEIHSIFSSHTYNRREPPTHFAAERGMIAALEEFKGSEAWQLETRDINGMNILHRAARKGQLNVFKWLDSCNEVLFGKLLFQDSITPGENPISLLLANKTIDNDEKDQQLYLIIKVLIANNQIGKVFPDGNNIAHIIAKHSITLNRSLTYLIDNYPQLFEHKNNINDTPTLSLIYQNHAEAFEKLLSKNIPGILDARDRHGNIPVHYISSYGIEIAELVLKENRNHFTQENDRGLTPIFTIAISIDYDIRANQATTNHLKVLSLLLTEFPEETINAVKRQSADIHFRSNLFHALVDNLNMALNDNDHDNPSFINTGLAIIETIAKRSPELLNMQDDQAKIDHYHEKIQGVLRGIQAEQSDENYNDTFSTPRR